MMPEVLEPLVKIMPDSPVLRVVLPFDFPLVVIGMAESEECIEIDISFSF